MIKAAGRGGWSEKESLILWYDMEGVMWAFLAVSLCLYWILTPGHEANQALDVLNSPRAAVPHMSSSLFSS